ncbi:MAG: MarR family transcriptional regulator [Hahellaceae bacterium]|nr:MarR family transcriptional regulator [Hahellaceae bacterium]
MSQRSALEYRATILLGIIQQLQTTRQTEMLKPFDMTRSQFSVLTHLALHPERRCTISGLAEVMEINQPGITKIVKKLADKALIDVIEDKQDKRKKHLEINRQGLSFVSQCQSTIQPDNAECYKSWNDNELHAFLESLDKLKTWLDSHRNDIQTD